jgi:hypothetical protein
MPILQTNLPLPIRFNYRASRRLALLACSLGFSCLAFAQFQIFPPDPNWKESEAPPPPAFSESRLVPIEMPAYSNLKFGVDPATITITGDGVVRYVVVGSNRAGGATNAFYEAVRCATGEFKTYARWGEDGWQPVANPDWKSIEDRNSRYTKALASQGICRGAAPRSSVRDMLQNIKNPSRELQ